MIEVRGLTHRFAEHVVLSDVSFRIHDGEYVVLVGANGAGKTTLLDHFSGLRTPHRGSVRIDDQDVATNPVLARTEIGRVFEDPRDQLLGATVGEDIAFGPENLGVPRREIEDRVASALAAVGMEGCKDTSIEALSGGERARIAIAGALAIEPRYLVLDEPTAGVDHPGRTAILGHLHELHRRGVGIILATHDLRDLEDHVDRVLGLVAGELVIDASPREAVDRLSAVGVRVPSAWENV